MSNIEATELKLKTTPTGGVEAAHSPYYRRLLSAGYKGFLQGSIGGASLYGAFGLVIGGLVYVAALPFLPAAAATTALALIPVCAGLGVLKGADTFGQIGSVAAINAEGSDPSEQRRYLLDRYYDLPPGPEGEREAEAIRQELLARASDTEKPPFFHWKTVAIGAVVGSLIALAVFSSTGIGLLGIGTFITKIGLAELLVPGSVALSATGMAIGAIAGALTGATIGIDRYYIRKWFDKSEGIIHPGSHDYGLMERHQQVERIKAAAKEDEKTKHQLDTNSLGEPPSISEKKEENTRPSPVAPNLDASAQASPSDKPPTSISNTRQLVGLAEIHQALDKPAL